MSEKLCYEIDCDRLRIIDPELSLLIDAPFDSQGAVVEYYPNGTMQRKCFYTEGVLHGPSYFYSETGRLLSEAWFCRGVQQGKLHQYYSSGTLYCIQNFKDGKREGPQRFFEEHDPSSKNSSLRTLMHYVGGLLHGEMILCWPNGMRKRQAFFEKGVRVGKECFWNQEGVLIDELDHCRFATS